MLRLTKYIEKKESYEMLHVALLEEAPLPVLLASWAAFFFAFLSARKSERRLASF
jgi:hypothetical protein